MNEGFDIKAAMHVASAPLPPVPALMAPAHCLTQGALNELIAISGNARHDCERLRVVLAKHIAQATGAAKTPSGAVEIYNAFFNLFARVNWVHNELMALKVAGREESKN